MVAVGTQVGYTGKWQIIRSLARRLKTSGGEGSTMTTVRDRIRGALGKLGGGRRGARE